MLQVKIDSEKYKGDFTRKFANFCEKSPVLLSFVMTEVGVTVIHANTGTKYEFPWDFTIPVKSFIHSIKEVLVENHYPRMIQTIEKSEALSAEEQAELLEQGVPPNELPTTKLIKTQRVWRISKLIVWRDIFILEDEVTGEQYRYRMNRSCVFFLKAYRAKKFTLESAWEYFIKNSVLLNKLEPKDIA